MPIIPTDQKFHTLDAETPTQERGSALANAGREIYTMQDIIDTVGGGGGGGVSSLDTLTGDITLVGAGDVTITNNGSDQITISAITGVASLEALTGALNIVGAGTVTVTDNGVDTITITGSGGGGSTTGEDLSLNVRSAPYSATGDHEGTVLSIGTLGLTAGTVYMWDGSEWGTANAGALATADGLMGVSTDTATAPDVLVSGIIQMSATGSAGDPLYLDTTSGLLTATAPGVGNIVRLMGYKLDSTRVYFNPSNDWLVT